MIIARRWLISLCLVMGLLRLASAQPTSDAKTEQQSPATPRDAKAPDKKTEPVSGKPAPTPPVAKSDDDPVPPPPPPRSNKKSAVAKGTEPKNKAPNPALPQGFPVPNLDDVKIKTPSAGPALARIQAALGQIPECDGIQITDARLEDDQGGLFLVAEGRLSEARLRAVAVKICSAVLQDLFASAGGVVPVPKLDHLAVVKPSQREAVNAFNEGLSHYRKGRYEAARQEFARAVFENPFNLSYKYWQVAAELALGHDEQARRLLRPLALRRLGTTSSNQSDEYLAVLRRLEPVQGTVRQKLNRLEEEFLREGSVKQRSSSQER